MYRLHICMHILCALIHLSSGRLKIPPNPVNYITRSSLMSGLVFPREIDAVVGEDVYFRITEPVSSQSHCLYRPADGTDRNVLTPHQPNVEAWKGEPCGVHIKNISVAEAGIWRLTSTNEQQNFARGVVVVNVQDKTVEHKQNIDSLKDSLMTADTAYCYVSRPDATESAGPWHEQCKFPDFLSDQEANGAWDVVGGMRGKTQEIAFRVNVRAQAEHIKASIEHDPQSGTLSMKCALMSSKKAMKFCRFVRVNGDVGLNLVEGRGNERYRYFGTGFKNHECGITLTRPLAGDRSPWKCFIGVEMDGATTTVGAILDAGESDVDDEIDADDVYAMEYTAANIMCKRNAVTDYCWFRDPSGRKISLSDRAHKRTDTHKYFGSGIGLGECGITIMNATHNDSGTWTCHMGMIGETRTDSSKEISVRITETSLVSTSLFQDAQVGSTLSIECKSIPSHVPLDYCRFVLPDGTGFSINQKTTSANAHMGTYSFNPNRQMSMGYCSIIVSKIDRSHMGQWTCAARLSGANFESHDEFRVIVFDGDTVAAGVIGMIVGAVTLVCSMAALAFVAWYRQRSVRRLPGLDYIVRFRRSNTADVVSISSDNSEITTNTALPMTRLR